MRSQAMFFKARAEARVADDALQAKLKAARSLFVEGRARAVEAFNADMADAAVPGDFQMLRHAGAAIRERTLVELDSWLERFEEKAGENGTQVLWARDSAEALTLIRDIARKHGVKKAVKSKSMLSEELGLNDALQASGVQVIETDLGEYIIQLAKESPSHIIAPAIHKNKEEVAELFARIHRKPLKNEIPDMTREAREVLREHFLSADMGISGANFLVAETGSVALVTNEGNGRMVTTLPRVHVAIAGIEKVVPTLDDLAVLLRLLPRSATGQSISNYVSLLTGVRGAADSDGPEQMYVILVDNGRSDLLGGEYQSMLRCIRCGACMNHCPVYQTIGGHAYGWVYPGPMGSVLTPLLTGLENAPDLPYAATLCNQCGVVCPVEIPLPDLLRRLRQKARDERIVSWPERVALAAWSFVACRPPLYALFARLGARYLKWLASPRGRIEVLGLMPEWTLGRDLPAPAGKTFRELYKRKTQ